MQKGARELAAEKAAGTPLCGKSAPARKGCGSLKNLHNGLPAEKQSKRKETKCKMLC
jgi:hypothetical protein